MADNRSDDERSEDEYVNSPEAETHLLIAMRLLSETRDVAKEQFDVQAGPYIIALVNELAATAVAQEKPNSDPDKGYQVLCKMLKECMNDMREEKKKLVIEEAPQPRMRVTITRTERAPDDSITEQINAAIQRGASKK